MQEGFHKIMALEDFSNTSQHAIEEAAMIASKFNSELHLLHVWQGTETSYLAAPEAYFFEVAEDNKEITRNDKSRLKKVSTELKERFKINVEFHEATGNLSKLVSKYVCDLNIDLVVLGAKRKNWVREFFIKSHVKKIIRSVNREVLCVYPDSNSNKLKKIVLPVGDFIPKRKIRLAYELAKKFAANVHLISLNNNGSYINNEDTKALMASYKYFKDITNIPIECRTVQGDNLAQATLHYAKNIGADLILINPGRESHFGVLSRWGSNIVNHSSIPILCVHAINDTSNHRQYRA